MAPSSLVHPAGGRSGHPGSITREAEKRQAEEPRTVSGGPRAEAETEADVGVGAGVFRHHHQSRAYLRQSSCPADTRYRITTRHTHISHERGAEALLLLG